MLDVAIVGFGPVGQALAILLGGAGHRVGVFERFEESYRLPRAVHLDHETMRILQRLGVADALAGDMLSVLDYHWFGADGESLMTLEPQVPAVSGWDPDYLFHQPDLEDALEARARSLATVSIERGWEIDHVDSAADHSVLQMHRRADGAPRFVETRWTIGADGANSAVRESLGIPRRDLGFQEKWLVVDVEPRDMAALDLPAACQWCDPRRPTTHVQSGRRHRRWEFMLLPGEDAADFDEGRAWELLEPWFEPQDGVLVRHAVYEFRSMLAEPMRSGRALLAGDSAHLTPPFLGQGLCAGLRDALNIAWKLDLVLRGLAGETLMDSVTLERQPQNEWIIGIAIELGKALCELDAAKAAERDTAIRAAGPPPELGTAPMTDGALRPGDPVAGTLGIQPRLGIGGSTGLMDELTGGGFTLLTRGPDPLDELDEDARSLLHVLDVHVVDLAHTADPDGVATAFLDGHGLYAVLSRPDFYVFGGARAPEGLPALIDDLREQLLINDSRSSRWLTPPRSTRRFTTST